MRTFILRRLLLTIPTIIGLTIIVFLAVRLLPGDVIDAMSAGQVAVDEAKRQVIRERLGLADPLPIQYINWLGDIISGDLGVSLRNAQPLRDVFLRALPVTMELGILAALIASFVGIPLGLLSAIRRYSLLDFSARLLGLIGLSFPNFWLATLVILFNIFMARLDSRSFLHPNLGRPDW